MAIFTSHISGSSGGTSLTGSFRLMSPHGTPQDMILTASFQSFGPSIGIGTSTTPNTTFAINSDLGLSDDATNSRFSIANTNAYVNLGTDVNNRSFLLWENGSSRLRVGTKQSGVNYFNTLHLKSGQVGIGGDSSGMDLHVRGPNKTAIIGPPSGDPLVDSTLYFANDRTFIGHDTQYGGNFVLASTASILLGGDRDDDGAVDFVYLKGRNDLEDVRVEAPSGMNIDNNLSVTGSLHIKSDGSGDERLIVSGSGHDSVSITPGGSYLPGIKVDRDSETAIIGLRRVQTAIDTGDELAKIELGGSETGGGSSQGGGAIVSTAAQPFDVSTARAYSDLSFHNTSNTSGLYAVPAMTFSGSLGNVAHFNSSIYTDGNLSLKYGGGPAQILVGNSVAMTVYDSNRNVEFTNDIIVGSGIIQNSEGEETITMSEYADVVVRGHLNVYGGEIEVTGSNPTVTIGDGTTEEDVKTVYKGRTSYYMGVDDTDEELYIGAGTSVGASSALKIGQLAVTSSLPMQVGDGLFFSPTTNQGIMNSPGVRLNNSAGTSATSARYIKLAEFPAGPTLGASDTLVTNLLVTVTGREYSSSYTTDLSLLVNIRYSYYATLPYYYSNGTGVSVTPLGNDFAEMGDVFYPHQQLYLTTGPGGNPELWLESSITGDASRYLHRYASVFVTHLGGSGNASTSYTNAALEIMSNGLSEWVSDDPKAVVDRQVIYANYSDAYAGPGAILEEVQITGATSHDVTNAQSVITTAAGNPWEATFTAPRSGAVLITVQFMAKYAASDVYLALGLVNESGTIYGDGRMRMVAGSRYSAADYDYETIQYTFRFDSLIAGNEYTVRPVVDGAEDPDGTTGGYTTGEIVIACGAEPGSITAWANAQGRILVQAARESHGYTSIS